MDTQIDLKTVLETCESFVQPATHLLTTMVGVETHVGQVYTRPNTQPSYDVVVVVGVTGPWKGAMIISLDQKVAYQMAGKMMRGLPIKAVDHAVITDAIAEFANIVAGNALIYLKDRCNVSLSISPPTNLFGAKSEIRLAGVVDMHVVPFDTSIGCVELGIALSADGVSNEDHVTETVIEALG